MLDTNNSNHLNLLYEQLINFNNEIKNAILKADMDTLENSTRNKQALIDKILAFEKPYIEDIKKDQYLYSKRLKIAQMEQENINLLGSIKEELRAKILSVSKTKRIFSAYEPSINNVQSTFEIQDDE